MLPVYGMDSWETPTEIHSGQQARKGFHGKDKGRGYTKVKAKHPGLRTENKDTVGIHPDELKTDFLTKICTQMFIAASFIIVKT